MVGKPDFLRNEKITGLEPLEASAVKLQEEGKTAMFVAIDGKPAGILAVADPIKSTTAEAIRELHALGLKLVMLTGDNRRTAAAVAKQLGLDAVEAEIEPAGKVAHVKKLRAEGKHVAMAGDGINDAPALSEAEVGIAMGTGTDVAMQSAGITLVKGDLRGIAKAIRLSRATMRNIRQNLFFAFLYNALGIPVAAGVLYPFFGLLLSPIIAGAAMSLSSVSVISNALRLRKVSVVILGMKNENKIETLTPEQLQTTPGAADEKELAVKTNTLTPELLHKMDAYWRAANYLSVGQIYLYDNPLLKQPLKLSHVKPLVVGHWGTTPGQNFIYVHLNRVIKKYDLDMFYIAGPGHGGPAIVGNVYLEGTWSEVYPNVTQDEAGLKKLFMQFSFPGGISSHVAPTTPGSIHEGGELGYSLSHAFGAAFDNPDLIVACVVGDGEAETGPLATAWQSNKFLDPITDGAVLPILHLNGYKISNPTVLARIEHEELEQFLRGCGWTPYFVEGDEPETMHQLMAATLDKAIEEIRQIQKNARDNRRYDSAALADDRPEVTQGLDGTESGRRTADRGHLPSAPSADPGGFRASRSCQAARRLDEELQGRGTVR